MMGFSPCPMSALLYLSFPLPPNLPTFRVSLKYALKLESDMCHLDVENSGISGKCACREKLLNQRWCGVYYKNYQEGLGASSIHTWKACMWEKKLMLRYLQKYRFQFQSSHKETITAFFFFFFCGIGV
jgi:hypothetical protein